MEHLSLDSFSLFISNQMKEDGNDATFAKSAYEFRSFLLAAKVQYSFFHILWYFRVVQIAIHQILSKVGVIKGLLLCCTHDATLWWRHHVRRRFLCFFGC